MTCTITQADLGKKFADVDPDVVDDWITMATEQVYAIASHRAWKACGIDPCGAIKLLARHLLSLDPDTDVDASQNTSASIGGVSVSTANNESLSGLYTGTPYGRLLAAKIGLLRKCQSRRRHLPFAVGPRGVY
jgi:hypothetical protein